VWETARRLGIPVLVVALPERAGELAGGLARVPSIPIVIDHGGLLEPVHGVPDELAALAPLPHVSLKLSTVALRLAEAHGDPAHYVAELAARFGASRLMWGSDWSHTRMWPYAEIVDYGRRAAARLDASAREDFLAGTALRHWPELGRALSPGAASR
jgi:predicted TIM-barrel fold metal-dependent hydrolase